MIMASKNGRTWQVAYRDFNINRSDYNNQEILFGAAYDERVRKFYAASWYVETVIDPGTFATSVTEGERLYTSSDGATWSKVDEQMRTGANAGLWPVDAPSLLVPHCAKPQNEGADKTKKIPDGLQGYAKGGDTFVKPFDLNYYSIYGVFYSYSPEPPAKAVKVTRPMHGEHPLEQKRNVGMPCTCVASNGSIWAAGGGGGAVDKRSRVDVSFDGGETWIESFTAAKDENESDSESGRRINIILARTSPAS
jgi:hypothetical protein